MYDCVIVISNYNKSLVWTLRLLEYVKKIYVYDHDTIIPENEFILHNDNYHYEQIQNKGCEASAYLKYMIDNYYELPNKIILVHDEEFSWHHTGSIIDLIKDNITRNDIYINLNNYVWGNVNTDECGYIDQFRLDDPYNKLYKKLLEPYFGDIRIYSNFITNYAGCAQFIINKSCITRNNIQLYKDLYSDGRVPSRQKSIIRKMYKEWETRKVSKKTKLIYSSKFTEIHKKLQTL